MTARAQYDFMSRNTNASIRITSKQHNVGKFLISVDKNFKLN